MSARRARNPAYRNPPQDHRFKKGQSGNPRGRPRTGDTRTLPMDSYGELFRKVSGELMQITINGKPCRVSGREAYLRTLQSRAIRGERGASREYSALLLRFGPSLEATTGTHEDFLAELEAEPPPHPEPDQA